MHPHQLPRNRRAGLAALCMAALLVLGGCQPQPGAKPHLADSWYIQLSGTVDTTQPARVFDVDGFDTTAATVATLHAEGKLVVCYLDVGSVESYRPDYPDFAAVPVRTQPRVARRAVARHPAPRRRRADWPDAPPAPRRRGSTCAGARASMPSTPT